VEGGDGAWREGRGACSGVLAGCSWASARISKG
jgi:hypothetical protein